MKNRLKCVFTSDCQYGDFKEGDKGFIDGYIRCADDQPYVVVYIKERKTLVTAHFNQIEVLDDED